MNPHARKARLHWLCEGLPAPHTSRLKVSHYDTARSGDLHRTARSRCLPVLFILLSGCATVRLPQVNAPRPFQFPQDTFAFANETVFAYENGRRVVDQRAGGERYSRRCFVMAAAAVQFWKHARFEPDTPPLARCELAESVRALTRRAAWTPLSDESERIVFPGYASLRELSEHEGKILRANLGPGWTTYFHVRKNVMVFPMSNAEQARIRNEIDAWLARGYPLVLWLYNFPSLNINHAVVAYAKRGDDRYSVYDPNFTEAPRTLRYNARAKMFSYEKTFYFVGGPIKVRSMYLGLWR
jgi:hypothetical protein